MDIFSNLQVIGECLLDKKRVTSFEKAISEVVKEGDIVLDCGTGSGILALFAAKAGASKVYAVEIAEDIAEFARKNVEASKYSSQIAVINTDAKNLKLSEKIDVVTAEMLDTCLVAEQQAQAMNRLLEIGIIDGDTRIVPFKLDCIVQGIEYDFDFYGFNMPFVIQARNFGATEHIKNKLSNSEVFKQIVFNSKIDTNVGEEIKLIIQRTGVLNAIKLTSKTYLSPSVAVGPTADMNMPVIIPLGPIKVEKEDNVSIYIQYKMGEGFENFSVQILEKSL